MNGIGESSKIVPTRTLNCFLHSLQRQIFRLLIAWTEADPQPIRGQATPFGQRIVTA